MPGKLYGIGVGPGDPELMTLKALRLIKECDVIGIPGKNPDDSVAYRIALGACPEIKEKEHLPVVTPMTKDMDILEKGYQESAEKIINCLNCGKSVALLTLGDPTIYSTYIYIHRKVLAAGFEATIVSGVPSFCAVAAKIGDSLVDRDQKLHVIPASYQMEDALALDGTKVFMKAASELGKVGQIIRESECNAYMIENCGMPDETVCLDKKDFPEKGSYYSIIVVKDTCNPDTDKKLLVNK